MNSLAYVARQFDVLAAPRAPPSTPTSDRFSQNDAANLQRVNTWSTKSFLFAPRSRPQRSHSSPSFPSISRQQHPPTSSSAAQVDVNVDALPQSRSKHDLESVINQIFFLRVFLVVWHKLKAVWTSFLGHLDAFSALSWRKAIVAIEISPPDEKGKGRAFSIAPEPPLSPSVSQSHLSPDTEHLLQSESSSSSTPVSGTPSRQATPVLTTKKSPFLPKTLVLDLDETLIHSTSRPMPSQGGWGFIGRGNKPAGRMVEVVLNGKSTLYHVYKRPFVDFFLRTVSGWYTLVIFTASMQEYADPVIDWLDAGTGILSNRFFRDSCTQLPNGTYTKDLSIIEADLSRVCLIDNSPISYSVNEANGIPIEGWTNDPTDEALLDLLPVLDSLRFTSDVRRVLGLRCVASRRSDS
ncbi:NLI interacting factor-like phosphatase [Coprinopsis cinerea okayama7|uniref:NLI interacting factor-like phosphatase n=1 Tax=Coprinopsis cinerea (strain Okayama-7 / 130 / ATCC MYA-4618 / FGSC 9003) TaxID=240176 RepID=A8NXC4_COPC7|nr:NLI interacting factor-like phosphatase [Coprinopsis cinerea okayama7\|eukprot:XP_001837128.2 NLI interacting factor-like phosphatase [Coprinopsis cinerea okayama7\